MSTSELKLNGNRDAPPGAQAPHVALFIPTMRGGGAEKAWANLAGGLVGRGVRVDLVLMERDGPYLSHLPAQVRIVDLADPSYSYPSLLRLRRYLRRERPRTLIAALKEPCRIALLAKRLGAGGTRVVTTLHNMLWDWDKRPAYVAGRRFGYAWADEIVAVSSGVADDFARFSRLPRERLKVIYNPIVSPELERMAGDEVGHPWFAPGGPPVIVSAGRLCPEKDFATLIRAFALVRARRPARLVILGQGAERKNLEALVAELGLGESVALAGFVNNPYAYMSRAALFALSSTAEGFGNVIVEALAVGTPVVSTDCRSGPREILDGGRYGKLAPVGDAAALAEAIDEQLSRPHDKESLRARAGKFSVGNATDQYLEVAGLTG